MVSPVEMARTLSEVKDALRSYETMALADVATTPAEVADSLAITAMALKKLSPNDWMDTEPLGKQLWKTCCACRLACCPPSAA